MHPTITPDILKVLANLKALMAEKGYDTCEVASFFRRSEHDFLAYDKTRVSKFVVVRPTLAGRVSVTPCVSWSLFGTLRKDIRKSQKPYPVRVHTHKKALKFLNARPEWWRDYFPSSVLNSLKTAGF